MKRYRYFSNVLMSVSPHTDHTRRFLEKTQKLSREYIQFAVEAAQANLRDAQLHFKPEDANYEKAKCCFEDAIVMADVIFNDEEALAALKKDQSKALAETYAAYADFLRQTISAKDYETVRKYINKALTLDPKNRLAECTSDDIRVNFHT